MKYPEHDLPYNPMPVKRVNLPPNDEPAPDEPTVGGGQSKVKVSTIVRWVGIVAGLFRKRRR